MISSSRNEAARALLIWLISCASAFGQESQIEIRAPAAKLIETAPGRIVTTSVTVANRTDAADEFDDRLTLPAGCQRVAPPPMPFRIDAGAEVMRVLAVFVPQNIAAGDHEVIYSAQSRRNPSWHESVRIALHVTPMERLRLEVEKPPAFVIAGDVYKIKLRLTNGGNAPLKGRLDATSTLGFALNLESSSLALEPLAAREIVCTVRTDKKFPQHTNDTVTFKVSATSASGKILTARQASIVEIIPVISGNRDPYQYLPVQYSTTTLAQSGRGPQVQIALSGGGWLDEEGKHRVDVLLRGPDVQDASGFGERDQYGASYHGPTWDIDAGDRIYSLSPLTEKQTLARGFGLKWHDDNRAVGLFYATTRFRRENTEELGAFLRQNITPSLDLQANALRKSAGNYFPTTNLFTLESHYTDDKLIDLRLEAGLSKTDDGATDFACRIAARGELPGEIRYAVEHTRAGDDFHGYYSNANSVFASASKKFAPKFGVNVSLNHYEANPAVGDIRSTVVNREDSWNARATYSLDKVSDLLLEAHHLARQDILLPAAYDFSEDFARIGASHNFGRLQLRGSIDLGVSDNILIHDAGGLQRYNVFASWRPSPAQSYSVFASYGPSPFSGSRQRAFITGASTHWQLKSNIDAEVSYSRNQFDMLTGSEYDQVLASLRYKFGDERSVSLTTRWSHTASRVSAVPNENAIFVGYSIPLGLPVSRKTSIGGLQGRIFDSSDLARPGLDRVVVQAGDQYAVTDAEGRFEFPALKPGEAEVRVLPNSLGANFTMANETPLKAEIRPATTKTIALPATPASSLTVRITKYDFADGKSLESSGDLKEAGGLEGALVEISSGTNLWRAQTDRTGVATFERLVLGKWTLRVAADLPPLQNLEEAERTITLAAGQTQDAIVRVIPQRRTLRVLESGVVR
jgi:hypothetical protein